jgi:uncharacterized protein YbjT (DUF2867 family)
MSSSPIAETSARLRGTCPDPRRRESKFLAATNQAGARIRAQGARHLEGDAAAAHCSTPHSRCFGRPTRAGRVRLLVRDITGDRDKLEPLVKGGAEMIEGDLANPASLDRATRDVDVVVSAVQGGPDVIVDGQVALAKAGKAIGVRRILPSDYALDLFKATPGEHAMFDMRAEADRRIAALELEQVNVFQGGFMDMFLPGHGAIDLDAGTINFFGDGNCKVEVTSVEDTARMVARVALDRTVPAGKFAFAGDRISFREAGRGLRSAVASACERAGQVGALQQAQGGGLMPRKSRRRPHNMGTVSCARCAPTGAIATITRCEITSAGRSAPRSCSQRTTRIRTRRDDRPHPGRGPHRYRWLRCGYAGGRRTRREVVSI